MTIVIISFSESVDLGNIEIHIVTVRPLYVLHSGHALCGSLYSPQWEQVIRFGALAFL